jgi:hypothetical protein
MKVNEVDRTGVIVYMQPEDMLPLWFTTRSHVQGRQQGDSSNTLSSNGTAFILVVSL